MAADARSKSKKKPAAKKPDPWRDIRDYLGTQAPGVLIDLLLDVAQRDDRLFQSLLLNAERAGGGDKVDKAFRKAIDGATSVDDYIGYREVRDFAENYRRGRRFAGGVAEP